MAYRLARDPVSLAATYVPDPHREVYLGFWVKGDPYNLWGLFPADHHLFGPADPAQPVFLLGADRLGRDMLSRIIFGARASLSIGLVGVTCSLLLGIIFGGISGYFGGRIDWAVQRVIEFIISLPTIPIWLALAAALPKSWSPLITYFCITLIISLIAWTELPAWCVGDSLPSGRRLTSPLPGWTVAARHASFFATCCRRWPATSSPL